MVPLPRPDRSHRDGCVGPASGLLGQKLTDEIAEGDGASDLMNPANDEGQFIVFTNTESVRWRGAWPVVKEGSGTWDHPAASGW